MAPSEPHQHLGTLILHYYRYVQKRLWELDFAGKVVLEKFSYIYKHEKRFSLVWPPYLGGHDLMKFDTALQQEASVYVNLNFPGPMVLGKIFKDFPH
jgi:hypothetical protein